MAGGHWKKGKEGKNNRFSSQDNESQEYFDDQGGGDDGDDATDNNKPAPQAREIPPPIRQASTSDSVGELVDCKLSPLDVENQRQNLKDVLTDRAAAAAPPPPLGGDHSSNNGNGNGNHNNDHHRVQFAEPPQGSSPHHHEESALHQDEYSQYNRHGRAHDPQNHESALASSHHNDDDGNNNNGGNARNDGLGGKLDNNPFAARKKHRLAAGGGSNRGKGHSHPRTSPYRSEVARLRHVRQLEREKKRFSTNEDPPPEGDDDASGRSAVSGGSAPSIRDTTAPPETHFFAVQSSKLKHSLLHSLGEFLTSAFADDEEASGSYFSRDLLDQLSDSNPHLRGVWLQAKNLNDAHVKDLCHALIRNKVVTEVWLPSNQISDEGCGHIAHMLKFNRTIKELFLGDNDIGPKGAAALASALARGNGTLVALGLGNNRIGVEGAGAFAAALRHNHSLHTLDVKNNGIPKKSSIRALLNKMLEFNASDPGDESLVLGLQEELAGLVSNLPPDMAEHVVLQAEEALKSAMLCRKRGDKVGAAEAEGIFIRICTTGEPPVDPPEADERAEGGDPEPERNVAKSMNKKNKSVRAKKPMEPDRLDGLNDELSALKFNDDGNGNDGEVGGEPALSQADPQGEDGVGASVVVSDEVATSPAEDEQPMQNENEAKKAVEKESSGAAADDASEKE